MALRPVGAPADDPDRRLLATVEQLKARMNTREGGATNEELLTDLLEAASNRIEEMSGRTFLPDPYEREDGTASAPVAVRHSSAFGSTWAMGHDCRQATLVLADGIDVTGTARLIRMRPDHPAHAVRLPEPARDVEIRGHFGWWPMPAAVRDAALGWAQRAYHEHRARMSDAQADPDGGGYVSYFRQVPPFVTAALAIYTVPGL